MRPSLVLAGLGVTFSLVVVAGCTSRSPAKVTTSATTSQSSATGQASTPSSTEVGSPTANDTSAPASAPSGVAAGSAHAAPKSTAAAAAGGGASGCVSPAVKVELFDDGSAGQMQYAEIQVTNTGTSSCSLNGFAGITLVSQGAPVGSPATHSGSATALALAPGAKAVARVTDQSTCSASLSDSARITLPNSTTYIDAAIALRVCALQVTAFQSA